MFEMQSLRSLEMSSMPAVAQCTTQLRASLFEAMASPSIGGSIKSDRLIQVDWRSLWEI